MAKKVAYYGIFTALAILLGYVEAMVAIPLPVPGAKLGLPNLVILLALYLMGPKAAFSLSVLRVALSSLLFSGFAAFWFSLAGAALSFLIMVSTYKLPKFSVIGVSVLGGVCHNLGQLVVAGIVVQNMNMVYYLPLLLVFGVAAGAVMGIIANACIPHLRRIFQ